VRAQRGQRGRGPRLPQRPLDFLGIPAVIETALERLPAGPVRAFESLYEADREAREVASELIAVRT
jgi:1-deoxy-D-xylulose-5-phosphate reductoisomerase